jgi:3-mercaptopyruvate sulfurtransferase SseA
MTMHGWASKGKAVIVPVLAIAVTLAVVWFVNRPAKARMVTWSDVQAEAGTGGYTLVTTKQVKQVLDRDPANILVVDTRQPWEFRTGHIPGALSFPMEPTKWARWTKRGELRAALGPDRHRVIVFY